MYLLLNLNESYTDVRSRHLFWTAVHRGISAHPDTINKYGIKYDCDSCSHHLVAKITYERYGTKDWEALGGYELYESIHKEEFIRILFQDPLYVIESYLYKPILFVNSYFDSTYYKASNYLIKWYILCALVVGSLMAGNVFLKLWYQYFFLLVLGLAFSLLPTMIAMPKPQLISDPALLLTFLIYMMISGTLCCAAQYLRLGSTESEKIRLENVK